MSETPAQDTCEQPPPPRRAPGGFPVVGVVGGGQLARMMQGPAVELGIQLSVLAEAPDAAAALVVPSAPVGDHKDVEAVRAFARFCDVVTFDHEHVPAPVLDALIADGVALHPRPEALRFAQDKLAMRERLTALGIPCPRWARASTSVDVEAFAALVGWPLVAKTPRGGYDGKGVRMVTAAGELDDWLAEVGGGGSLHDGILLEERVPFTRSSPSSWPAALPGRRRPGRSWRRCRPTASAPRCWPPLRASTPTSPRWRRPPASGSPASSG